MDAKLVRRLEGIAIGDLFKYGRTLKRIKHWQKRLWKAQNG